MCFFREYLSVPKKKRVAMYTTADDVLVELCFTDAKYTTAIHAGTLGEVKKHPGVSRCRREVEEYLLGKRKKFDVPFRFLWGTAFQKRVWKEMYKIGYGKTLSYEKLAEKAANSRSVRAVASAVSHNPMIFVLPCHRVIRKSGETGQYQGSPELKKTLLDRERHSK